MVSNRNTHYWMGFCRSLFWVWNYSTLRLWLSMMQMDKGLEHVLGQFTDGTTWKEASAHCRNLELKSSWRAGETVWSYVQQGWVQSTALRTFQSHPGRQEPRGQSWRQQRWRQQLCRGRAVPQQTQPATSAAQVEAKSDRSTVLLSLCPSTKYRHRSGRKVIRMIEAGGK